MNNKYEAILEAATEWLDNVDADEFLENFLVLQEQATGPTVHEFLNGSFAQEAIGVENSDSDSKERVHIYGNTVLDCSETKMITILDSLKHEKNYFVELNYLKSKLKVRYKTDNKYSYRFLLDDTGESLSYSA